VRGSGINISRYFFLILFLGFFASATFFPHSHQYNGNIIVHSHPFKHNKEGKPIHTHSDSGYQLIYLLNNYIARIAIGLSLAFVVFQLLKEIIPQTIRSFCSRVEKSSILLRGPPH
jgi:hypothetical protein